jgi:tRNA G18 (ribose-2'-O)-methylase SpoU
VGLQQAVGSQQAMRSQQRATIVVVGAEGPGLSVELMEGATRRVRIPMAVGVDSLNVASAAAVALSHLYTAAHLYTGAQPCAARPAGQ